jgi:protein-tyrosine phosphatase family protein
MTPQYMTAADARKASTLGIELVIDLRGERYPSSGPFGEPPAVRHAAGPASAWQPSDNLEEFMAAAPEDALPRVLDVYGQYFANGVRAMSEHPDGPVLFHCRLGKDRSGVFAALLLKLAGVADDDIMADYILTQRDEEAMREFILRAEAEAPIREARLTSEPIRRESIEAVLQRLVSKYGGAYGYFARFGVSAHTLDAVVESLLEPASG